MKLWIPFFIILLFNPEFIFAQKTYSSTYLGKAEWKNLMNKVKVSEIEMIESRAKLIKLGFPKKIKSPYFSKQITLTRNKDSLVLKSPFKLKVNFKGFPLSKSNFEKIGPMIYRDNAKFNVSYMSNKNGFPGGGTAAFTEDNSNHIWMISGNCILEYNGSTFVKYESELLDGKFLDDICFDNKTGLWITSAKGMYLIRNDSIFVPIIKDYTNEVTSKSIYKDKNGVWICTHLGIYQFTSLKDVIIYNKANGLPTSKINCLDRDKEGNLWIATEDCGVLKVTENKIINYLYDKSILDVSFHSICVMGNSVWVGGFGSGLLKIHENQLTVYSVYGSYTERVYDIIPYNNGILTSMYGGGLAYFAEDDFFHLDSQNGLPDIVNYRIFKDSFNKIWISDFTFGFSRLNENSLYLNTGEGDFLKLIVNLKKDKNGNFWYFQNGSFPVKETKDSIYAYYNETIGKISPLRYAMDGVIDDRGGVWMASYSDGICHPDGNQMVFYECLETNQEEIIQSAAKDGNDNLWFGTEYNGLILKEKSKFYIYDLNKTNGKNIIQGLFSIGNNVLLGGNKGLRRIENKVVSELMIGKQIWKANVLSVVEVEENVVMIGTNDKGILIIDHEKVFAFNKKENEFPFQTIRSLFSDNKGGFWAVTENSIIHFKYKERKIIDLKIYHFPFGKGVSSLLFGYLDINERPSWSEISGKLEFHENFYQLKNEKPPLIAFDKLQLDGKSIEMGDEIKMSPNVRLTVFSNIIFWGNENQSESYLLLKNQSDGNIKRFRLNGINKIMLPELFPGEYSMQLEVKYKLKKYHSEEIFFRVNPYWYNTTIFRICIFLFIVLIIFVFFYFRSHRFKTKNMFLEQKIEERTIQLLLEKSELEKRNKIIGSQVEIMDSLVREVHHRVKNNLQIITAIIELKVMELNSESEKQHLNSINQRISAMAIVHELLYVKENQYKIDSMEYVNSLTKSILTMSETSNERIKLNLEVETIELNTRICISIGMIITEMMTNSLKYAFNKNSLNPMITIQMKRMASNRILLSISDNGNGMKIKNEDSVRMGRKLISIFTRQLNGEGIWENKNGVEYKLEFPI